MDVSKQVKCPIDLEWHIDKKTLNFRHSIDTRHFNIPGFGDIFYFLSICKDASTQKVTLSFELDSYRTKFKVNADLKFCYSFDEFPELKKVFSGVRKHDDKKLCSKIKLFEINFDQWNNRNHPIFDGNEIKIVVNGYLIVEEMAFMTLWAPSKLGDHPMENIWNEDNDKDFVIIVENKEIKVHKVLLHQESTVFARMFELNWKETTENQIKIPEFLFNIVKIATDMLDTGHYVKSGVFNNSEYFQLYQFADKYDMQILKIIIQNSIDFMPNTIVEYANMAVEYGFDEFEGWCMDYLILCLRCEYPVANIDSLNEKTKNTFLQKLFVAPKTIGSYKWKHKSINDENLL